MIKSFNHYLVESLGFENAVYLKNLLIGGGFLILGTLIGILICSHLGSKYMVDEDIPDLKLMVVYRNKKKLYVTGPFPKKADLFHAIFIMLLHELGLIKKSEFRPSEYNISKLFAFIIFFIAIVFIALGLYLSLSVLPIPDG